MSGTDGPLVPWGPHEPCDPNEQPPAPQSSALVVYTPRRRRWTKTVAAIGLVLLCAAPVAAGVGFLLASDRFSDALGAGGGQPDGGGTVSADAWGALSDLGEKVDFSLFVSHAAMDGAVARAFDKTKATADANADLGSGERLRIEAIDVVPNGPDLKLIARGTLENGFFGAELSARATLQPRLDRGGVKFVATAVETAIDGADLKRPTFSPGDAAAKAGPAVQAGYERLQDTLSVVASSLVLPVTLPGTAGSKGKRLPAAFMFDEAGLHVIGRLDAPAQTSDDDLLTGSLASAGLTLDHYRAAFRAAEENSIAPGSPSGMAELTLSRAAMSALLGDAGERTCSPLAMETEPLTLTGTVQLADPPASPQCGRIAAACAARDLCSRADECQDKVVEETVEETIQVPVQRNGCRRREYVCYGWGPYGCAWGEEVCVRPRRFTEYQDKVVQRVVAHTEAATAPQCQSLKAMQSGDPGLCDRLAAGKAPDCGLVSAGASVPDCEARAAILDRIRATPTATATLRIIGRGKLQSCQRGTIAADMGSAKIATAVSGRADILAEVTIRPDGRTDGDSALRCTLEPGAVLKGGAKVQANRADTVGLKATSRNGELVLAGAAGAGTLAIPLDRAIAASLFGAKSGVVYRCQVEGAGGATFAQWESRVGPTLEAMAAKAGKLVSSLPAPAFEARLPRTQLLGRDAEARVSDQGAVFVVR